MTRALVAAIDLANRGLIDADLGGGLIKQRVAREGGGKSSGYRSLVCFRHEERALFTFGYAKSDKPVLSLPKGQTSMRPSSGSTSRLQRSCSR